MPTTNCIIIDDEEKNIKLLQNMLEMHCRQVNVVATSADANKGLQLIEELHPQLVFFRCGNATPERFLTF